MIFIENDIPLTVATIDTDWHPSENIIDYYQIKKLDRMKEEFGFETSFPEWMWGWTGYSWDKTCFPEPEKFLAKLHKKGLKITLNLHPVFWQISRIFDLELLAQFGIAKTITEILYFKNPAYL